MKEEGKDQMIHALSREEEEENLAEIIDVAQENLERTQKYIDELSGELRDLLETYGTKDKEALALWHNTQSQLNENMQDLVRCKKARKKPYFGWIHFKNVNLTEDEAYYVGRVGITKDGSKPLVIDWRAPAASVYYENMLGRCRYVVKNDGVYEIDLKGKRTYEITDDKLVDYFDSDVVATDELLTKYLAKSKKAVLGEIIATIQKEQNEIIRKSPKTNLIVQGVAGSGKTTVAMHRISYILYNYEEFRPEDFYIIGSNRILLNYITSVLPDLDVYGIRQMTMEQLFTRLLYEDWDDQKFHILPLDRKDIRACVKGGYAWFHDLEDFCSNYEKMVIPGKDIYLEKNHTLLLDSDRIKTYLKSNPGVSMQSKIDMLNEILLSKLENELSGKYVSFTPIEKTELEKKYRFYFGKNEWKGSIFKLYQEFLQVQRENGKSVEVSEDSFDVYDLAALAYLYKRIKETDGIREASHVIIDEAQDFGMMAYGVLKYCMRDCTYTIMGDVSQNIYYGYGLNDWENLRKLILTGTFDSFGLLKKSGSIIFFVGLPPRNVLICYATLDRMEKQCCSFI
ncbi:MAG: DNA helicase UvrD, partial [Clostridia bacterium]|nr:DNA helicase UvrD [Clostridia bacterium]